MLWYPGTQLYPISIRILDVGQNPFALLEGANRPFALLSEFPVGD